MADQFNNILGLQLPTDPRWVNLAEISIGEILTDHAYCEQKAAMSAISIIQKYPHHAKLVDELSELVSEEWGHFRLVLNELKSRSIPLGKQRKDEYVNGLMEHMQKGGDVEGIMLDRLLIFAMIEARSCERFRLLADGLTDQRMKKFYTRFMESEAGHYRMFLDLCKEYIDEERVQTRWKFWLATEAKLLPTLPTRGDRMH
jgi:tRNA 2-(methylsulfanyl)-N6-isopentenyladenosine37 hydroxylase